MIYKEKPQSFWIFVIKHLDVMKSPTLELILMEIKLQVLDDHVVSIKVLKCRENESENRSENARRNVDQLGFYTC